VVTLLQFCVSLTVKAAACCLNVLASNSCKFYFVFFEIQSTLSVVVRIIIVYKNHLGVI
jgi:hypothetical protein